MDLEVGLGTAVGGARWVVSYKCGFILMCLDYLCVAQFFGFLKKLNIFHNLQSNHHIYYADSWFNGSTTFPSTPIISKKKKKKTTKFHFLSPKNTIQINVHWVWPFKNFKFNKNIIKLLKWKFSWLPKLPYAFWDINFNNQTEKFCHLRNIIFQRRLQLIFFFNNRQIFTFDGYD